MNFKLPSKSYRIVLLPLSWLYKLGVTIRNVLYDKKIYKSTRFSLPIICVGNLAVGGTGKSPMVEYIIRLLKEKHKIATLSRGYKRKTKGYALASDTTTALEIGDEPMQFHLKFPDVPVAVGEERVVAVPLLLQDKPETEVIILDDAFQHRAIEAGLNILLTDYANRFTTDYYLPAGELRDMKSNYKRADIIVVTKCNPQLTKEEKESITKEIEPLSHQSVYFTTTKYGDVRHILTKQTTGWNSEWEVLIVTGIANPTSLINMIEGNSRKTSVLRFSDHHIYTIDDLTAIQQKFNAIENDKKIILTTEKDAMRFQKFYKEIASLPMYFIEISHFFLFNEGANFDKQLLAFINDFKTK